MKKILFILLASVIIFASIFTVSAENIINNEDDFLNLVEETKYFKDYQSQIIKKDVLRQANTEVGKRYTVQYILESEEDSLKNLVIIGDDAGNILTAMIVYTDEKIFSTIDLIENTKSNIYLSARKPIYKCSKYTCTKYESKIGVHKDYGCSTIIGQGCNIFLAIGRPFTALLCKSGVWAACKLSVDQVCVEYYEELDVCGL